MEFKGTCFSCNKEFLVAHDDLIHFTKARKREWQTYECGQCGFVNKYARFSSNSNLVTTNPV